MTRGGRWMTALALLVVTVAPVGAETDRWSVRIVGGATAPHGRWVFVDGGDRLEVEFDRSPAWGAGAELRLSERLGLDLEATRSEVEGRLSGHAESLGGSFSNPLELTISTTRLGLPIHLTPGRRVDLIVAPSVAHVRYGELSVVFDAAGIDERVEFDNELTAGLAIRAETDLGRAVLSLGASWFDTSARAIEAEVDGERFEQEIDPLTVVFGIGARF